MSALILLGATFVAVLLLGMQSLLVNSGHRAAAFANSFLIGVSNLTLYKLAPAASGVWEIGAFLVGGPLGIVAAMMLHATVFRRKTP